MAHLGANPDQQRNNTERNSKEESSISAQIPTSSETRLNELEKRLIHLGAIPTSSRTRLNEFKRSFIHLGANPDDQRKKFCF